MTGATRKQKEKKSFLFESVYKSRMLLKKNWILVFSFMYLVLVDAMDRSLDYNGQNQKILNIFGNFFVDFLAI